MFTVKTRYYRSQSGKKCAEETIKTFKKINILINNAAVQFQ